LAFGVEGQKKIEATHVGIAGLGGLGSQAAIGLAYMGVGSFTLVDDDCADESSLNRMVTTFPADAEAQALKVALAERQIKLINPLAKVEVIPKNLRAREAMEALIQCPIIFGCVDGDGARLVLTELAAAYGATLIDSATEIIPEKGGVGDFGGRVVVARAGEFCLDCANEINMETAKQELEPEAVRAVRQAHGYGLGEQDKAASVVSLNGIIANLAVMEFLAMVTGLREVQRYLVYYGMRGIVKARTNPCREDCFICKVLACSRERANIFRYLMN
jgi:molybdopterin/thiamine biosynthesis adenylyltransferase